MAQWLAPAAITPGNAGESWLWFGNRVPAPLIPGCGALGKSLLLGSCADQMGRCQEGSKQAAWHSPAAPGDQTGPPHMNKSQSATSGCPGQVGRKAGDWAV